MKEGIDKSLYETEIAICKQSFSDRSGCNWGTCEECGVIPLLEKLHTGKIVEEECEVKKLREERLR